MVDNKTHLYGPDDAIKDRKNTEKKRDQQQFSRFSAAFSSALNTAGLEPKAPATQIDTKVQIGDPYDDTKGSVATTPQTVSFDVYGSNYTFYEVTTNVDFLFDELPTGRHITFTLDILVNQVAGVTITFSTVTNPPVLAGNDGDRYVLRFIAVNRTDPTGVNPPIQTITFLTGATATGGGVPDGTVENQHLEWDNTGLAWNAVDFLTMGATGPFADSGFIRFANNQIMLSVRNSSNSGNLEFKVTNDAPDFFDFTESANNEVTLRIRAQHAVDPDQSFTIKQFSGTGAASQFDFPSALNIVRGADLLISLPDASNIDFFKASDAFGFNLAGAAVVNMGVLNALVFNQFATIGKSISRFATGLHYDIENAAHIHLFRVSGATPADAFHVSATEVQVYSPLDFIPSTDGTLDLGVATFAWGDLHIGRTIFQNNQGVLATSPSIGSSSNALVLNTPTANQIFLQVNAVDEFFFDSLGFKIKNLNSIFFLDATDTQDARIEYLDPLFRFVGPDLEFEVTSVTPNFNFYGPNNAAPLIANLFKYFAKNSTPAFHEYARMEVIIDDAAALSEDGSIRWALTENGVEDVGYLRLNALFQEVQVFKDLRISNTRNFLPGIDLGSNIGSSSVAFNEGFFNRLIIGDRVRSNSSTSEMGFFVKAETGAIGTLGTMQAGVLEQAATPTDTTLNGFFGAFDGAFGFWRDTDNDANSRGFVRMNGVWYHWFLTNL